MQTSIHGSVACSSHRLVPKVGVALLNLVVFTHCQVLACTYGLVACSSHRLVPVVGVALLNLVVFTQFGVPTCTQDLAACSSRKLGPSSVSCLFSLVVFTQFAVTTRTQDLEACSSRRLGPSSVSCFCPTWTFDKKRLLQAPCALTPDTDLAQGLVNKVSAGGAPLGSQSSIVTFELGGKHAADILAASIQFGKDTFPLLASLARIQPSWYIEQLSAHHHDPAGHQCRPSTITPLL